MDPKPPAEPLADRHAPELLRVLAAELGCAQSSIIDFELTLCDTQPSQTWGLSGELLSVRKISQFQVATFLKWQPS